MKITRGRLKEIISEEIEIFMETTKEDLIEKDLIIGEGEIKPEGLKKLLEQLTKENDNS